MENYKLVKLGDVEKLRDGTAVEVKGQLHGGIAYSGSPQSRKDLYSFHVSLTSSKLQGDDNYDFLWVEFFPKWHSDTGNIKTSVEFRKIFENLRGKRVRLRGHVGYSADANRYGDRDPFYKTIRIDEIVAEGG